MKKRKISFDADDEHLDLAEKLALREGTTLNKLFDGWLRELASRQMRVQEMQDLMERLRYVNAGRKFTREEMNER